MRKVVEFRVDGYEPCPWSVPVITKWGGSFYPKKSKGLTLSLPDWQEKVREAARAAMVGIPMQIGPLRVDLTFYAETPRGHRHGALWVVNIRWSETANKGEGGWVKDAARSKTEPDTGNITKGVLDSLENIVYANDVQIRMTSEAAHFGPIPGVQVAVYAIEDGDFPGVGARVE